MLAIAKTKRSTARCAEFVIALLVVTVPFAATIIAGIIAWTHGVKSSDLVILAIMYTVTLFGVFGGFHRSFSHGSFDTVPAVRAALAVAGSMAFQGPVIRWVADHRRHHAFTDEELDPHSPVAIERGVLPSIVSFWHAHIGWFFDSERTVVRRFAQDLLNDPLIKRIDQFYFLWLLLSLALPCLFGFVVDHTLTGVLRGLLWGAGVRLFLVHHVTWSINSVCHCFGGRAYQTNDRSRNNWLLAILAFGEGWHNNHHAFPSSARHGIDRGQIDLSWLIIALLEKVGLAFQVHNVSPKIAIQRRVGSPIGQLQKMNPNP
jgi:stearoyl-CoA desaturase (delta-9 desaturase)